MDPNSNQPPGSGGGGGYGNPYYGGGGYQPAPMGYYYGSGGGTAAGTGSIGGTAGIGDTGGRRNIPNYSASQLSGGPSSHHPPLPGYTKIYLGQLPLHITEDNIADVFREYC